MAAGTRHGAPGDVSQAILPERSLFVRRVRDVVARSAVTCRSCTSVLEVARLLGRERVGSVVVVEADGQPVGIITDRDLRGKVVAEGLDPSGTLAGAVMSSPLIAVPPSAFAFEAVLEMTRHGVRHLAVTEDGRLVGIVSARDFLALESSHPVALARDIARAPSVSALAGLAARVVALVRQLVGQGGRPYDVGQIVAELNDRVVVRVQALARAGLQERGDTPPVPGCWLVLGSEARREQTLRTDQDNALVYADPPEDLREAAAGYYGRFAAAVIEGLLAVGFPPCPGGIMASNPRWCQPLSAWKKLFGRWIAVPNPEETLAASIHFDLRPVGGAQEIGAALAEYVRQEASASRLFLAALARDVVTRGLPLTVFGNIAVERHGPHRGAVDVKSAGSLQLVGAGRLHALELGSPETNTVDRFRESGARGLYTDAEVREITDAYQHLMRLRLVQQLEQLDRGAPPDNHVVPARLSRADALLFRDALRTAGRVQAGVRDRFVVRG
jgi:CBS domain-containing protein